jgi:hypothetical protein
MLGSWLYPRILCIWFVTSGHDGDFSLQNSGIKFLVAPNGASVSIGRHGDVFGINQGRWEDKMCCIFGKRTNELGVENYQDLASPFLCIYSDEWVQKDLE